MALPNFVQQYRVFPSNIYKAVSISQYDTFPSVVVLHHSACALEHFDSREMWLSSRCLLRLPSSGT